MKKVLFALALGTTFALTSCGNDDDSPSVECFDCTDSALNQTSRICHTAGTTEYTITVLGVTQTYQFTDVNSDWDTVKATLEAACN